MTDETRTDGPGLMDSTTDSTTDTSTDTDRARTDTAPVEDGIDTLDTLADDIDPSKVWDTEHNELGVYQVQKHTNGDVTILELSSFAGGWQIVAKEVDRQGELLAVEQVGSCADQTRAIGMCEYSLDANPKGVLGPGPAGDEEGGGGVMQQIMGMFGANQ